MGIVSYDAHKLWYVYENNKLLSISWDCQIDEFGKLNGIISEVIKLWYIPYSTLCAMCDLGFGYNPRMVY